MNKQNMELFRKDFKKAVETLERDHDIVLDLGNIGFSKNSFNTTLTVTNASELTPKALRKKEELQFNARCHVYGFKETDYRKIFKSVDGKGYVLFGFNPSAPKNAYNIEDTITGKPYRCPKLHYNYDRNNKQHCRYFATWIY